MCIDTKQQSNDFRNESDSTVTREIAEMKSPATLRIYTVLLTGSVTITSSGRLTTFTEMTIVSIFGNLRRTLIGCHFVTDVF